MIIKASQAVGKAGRRLYPISECQDILHHFATFETTPNNPFRPHRHERGELWYIVEGEAIVSLDGVEQAVEAGDLVVLGPNVEHGLRTETRAFWVCLG